MPKNTFTPDRLPWLAGALFILGLLVYLIQAFRFAHSSLPSLDEGAYLYKGYLFVSGAYRPFEPYGPLTNKAPLAFLIPGFIEFLFGPGLRTGRYFSILLGVLTIFGTAWTLNRLAGKWWAVFSVWVFALSPAIIKLHSIAVPEVLIACQLAWILALTLGENRRVWQVVAASALASLVVLTRQNMIFFLPFLFAYIFWKHGLKTGALALAAGILVFAAGHALYWPRILTMWTPWLPRELTPFLDDFRGPLRQITAWNPEIDWVNRTTAFFQGVRQHFPVLAASGACALLWLFAPKKDQRWRIEVIFLGSLYFTLTALHAWAAVGSNYDTYSCVYCFSPYLGFFDPVGILFVALCLFSVRDWQFAERPSALRTALAGIFVLAVSAGVGLSLFGDVDRSLLSLPVPRMQGGQILPGFTPLWDALINKFDLPSALLKKYAAGMLGLAAGLLVLLLAWLLWRRYRPAPAAYANAALIAFLVVGMLATPLMAGSESRPDCFSDVILQNEQVGSFLAGTIPPGSLVYWDGGLSTVPLLYVRDIRIFPPQLNDGYSFRIGGNADELHQFGLWNQELKDSWIASADIFVIQGWRFKDWRDVLTPAAYRELGSSPANASCEPGSGVRVFARNP